MHMGTDKKEGVDYDEGICNKVAGIEASDSFWHLPFFHGFDCLISGWVGGFKVKQSTGGIFYVKTNRFQVTPKVSHLHAVKRIFRYLKHQPNLGLWYPKDSPFHLEAFSDSDYAGDNHDRRSTSGGCK
ncbi:hypothetical protein Tco_0792499 [Tanacetum coccineum]